MLWQFVLYSATDFKQRTTISLFYSIKVRGECTYINPYLTFNILLDFPSSLDN